MKLETYRTHADTWRMFVDGKVHPKLVGFTSEEALVSYAQCMIMNGELKSNDGFELLTEYGPQYVVLDRELNFHFADDQLTIECVEIRDVPMPSRRRASSTTKTFINCSRHMLDEALDKLGYARKFGTP